MRKTRDTPCTVTRRNAFFGQGLPEKIYDKPIRPRQGLPFIWVFGAVILLAVPVEVVLPIPDSVYELHNRKPL